MNTVGHYKATLKESGSRRTAIMAAILPDIFVWLRGIPIKRWQNFCLTVHHSPRGLRWTKAINARLGQAFQYHHDQDTISHDFEYGEPEAFFMPKDYVLLFSGGLDSFIIWRLLGQPRAVFFNIGHKAASNELRLITSISQHYKGNIEVRDDLQLGTHELGTGYIPYRNLLFIMFASYICPNVVIGQILEHAPDKNWWFYRRAERMLHRISGGHFQGNGDRARVKVYAPFAHLTKTQLVRRYLDKFGTEAATDLSQFTTSCYGDIPGKMCGKCGSCFSRWVAMQNNGIDEASLYDTIPSKAAFLKRLSFADFKPYLLSMYVRRWLEARHFE